MEQILINEKSTVHKVSVEELYKKLETSENGLSSQEVKVRQKEFGLNKLTEQKKTPYIIKFLLQFKNFFSILLLTGSGLSFLSEYLSPNQGSIYVAWALLGVTLLNAFFTFFQEYKAEQAMESFKNLMTTKVHVMRDGKVDEIDSTELVPGDIVVLNEGDKISADGRLIEIYNLKVDHSTLTGESEPQLRSLDKTNDNPISSRNMIFSGTLVQNGSGKALITTTGDNTKIGTIAKMTHAVESEVSHMQKEIGHFIKIISYIAIFLGVSFFGLGFFIGNSIWTNLVFAIGIIVANVPEGLLPTVTLTLSLAARKMAKENALVKNIDSIETLGSLTVICSDKTGTLTQNKLGVRALYMNGVLYYHDPKKKTLFNGKTEQEVESIKGYYDMANIFYACNNSELDEKTKKIHGDPTEICLKQFIDPYFNLDSMKKNLKRTFEIPFESSKKYMITSNLVAKKEMGYIKGAPEIVLRKCKKMFENGSMKSLSSSMRRNILKMNAEYSKQGYRVLGFGQKILKNGLTKNTYEKELEKNDFVFYGLVIMQDPPRPEVKDAVIECNEAGIKIIVISGDQGSTVASIAEQVGIIKEGESPIIIESDELQKMTDKKLKSILKKDNLIFARSQPEDKMRIVKALKEMKEIVAVTGDGVNDAPALKAANVGISMGKTGTEVAKDASDIVLLDDNFATITKAIKYGRTVYDNIQSFIIYILTSNIPEILPFLLFVMLAPMNWPLSLTVLLILAIDLGTDMLPAISLGVEPPSADIMKRKPRSSNAKLCNKRMVIRSYGFQGPIESLFAFIVFFMILFEGGWTFSQGVPSPTNPVYMSAVTGFFATIIVCQIFNLFCCRTAHVSIFKTGLFKNKTALFGIASEISLLLALIYVPFLQTVFSTRPFSIKFLPIMILGGVILLAAEELRKYLYRRFGVLNIRSQ
jgi:sodium/potassium-transporting ATPase subunit alpha